MYIRLPLLLVVIQLLVVACAPLNGSAGRQQAEIEQLKKNQATITKQLAELQKLLEQRPQGQRLNPKTPATALDISGVQFLGNDDAPLTIIEFTDYQCPYCRRHAKNTLPQIVDQYVQTGKIRYGIMEFPLEQIHPAAFGLAELALCAGEQGKYWAMHDYILNNNPVSVASSITSETLKTVGLDERLYSDCRESGKYRARILNDLQAGKSVGMRGTPHFLIGQSVDQNSGQLKILASMRGAQSFAAFQANFDRALDSLSTPSADKSP